MVEACKESKDSIIYMGIYWNKGKKIKKLLLNQKKYVILIYSYWETVAKLSGEVQITNLVSDNQYRKNLIDFNTEYDN